MGSYDLLSIIIDGMTISARPVEWNSQDVVGDGYGKDGSPIFAIQYVTTCPYCASLISFSHELIEIKCDGCNRGNNVPLIINEPFEEVIVQPIEHVKISPDELEAIKRDLEL